MCIVPFGLWEYLPRRSSSYLKNHPQFLQWGLGRKCLLLSAIRVGMAMSSIHYFSSKSHFFLLVKNMAGVHINSKTK